MIESNIQVISHMIGSLKIEIHPDGRSAGHAAAHAATKAIKEQASAARAISVIFATGASQLETLRALTELAGLPWERVSGFHMDEYIGTGADHQASFRRYLRENLTNKVRMMDFSEIDGTSPDPEETCRVYAEKLLAADPQLCLLGIGENGHLAFNDPGEADFNDPLDVKVVRLDRVCRQQQAAEGWFERLQDVPELAITLTVPRLFRVPKLIATVPGTRKAVIVRRTLEEPISPQCPATILRTHPDATLYLDREAAAELDESILSR